MVRAIVGDGLVCVADGNVVEAEVELMWWMRDGGGRAGEVNK